MFNDQRMSNSQSPRVVLPEFRGEKLFFAIFCGKKIPVCVVGGSLGFAPFAHSGGQIGIRSFGPTKWRTKFLGMVASPVRVVRLKGLGVVTSRLCIVCISAANPVRVFRVFRGEKSYP
jgi:hypothetical protein